MAKLNKKQIKHIAKLAELDLSEKEIIGFSSQLAEILAYIEDISKLNTKNIKPVWQVTGLENIWREDEIKPGLSQEQALSNAKRKYKGYFQVKAIFND